MANIHERLYMSNDLARIDFVEYIHSLVGTLFQTYGLSSDNISLDIVVEKVLLDLDRAIPCGLMVNELISNALKYAFPDGEKGEILVQMGHVDQDVLLVVKDDGVGLPEDMDIRTSTSLGMQLINTLVRQLDGDLELVNAHGTEVRVRFPLEKGSA